MFGYTINEKGYKVLPPYVGVLQGDGINERSLEMILANVMAAGWATGNLVFGMGGGLTHEAGRDEFSFSQKATAMSYDSVLDQVDEWISLKKEPITDLGKTSLSGYIVNVVRDGEVVSIDRRTMAANDVIADVTIFENGDDSFVDTVNFDDVRTRAAA